MKIYHIGLVLLWGGLVLPQSAYSLSVEEWVERLSPLTHEEVLVSIVEDAQNWPKLDSLSKTDVVVQGDVQQLTTQVLEALKAEASSIATDSSSKSIIERAELAVNISKIARKAGGYLNDLISVSSENVGVIGAWIALNKNPEFAPMVKKVVFRDSEKEPLRAKDWFTDRIELDDWLSERKDRLDEIEDDTPGFQTGNYLGYQRSYPDNEKPTVFEMIETPDLNVLWWQKFYNDFNLASTIPAACDYVTKGGVLIPPPKHKPNAVAAVFGDEGVPYPHELRENSFRSSDIWVSHDLLAEKISRDENIRIWFGE